ncbi:MAG: hypothetical protein JWO97_1700 [Acidobacteria bacterium]|nr:hypothetical protein [Acidobacteriota bacterium]
MSVAGEEAVAISSSFLRIGGLGIALHYADDSLGRGLSATTGRFAVSPIADADLTLTVDYLRERDLAARGELLFESGGVWRLYADGDGYRIECHSAMFGDAPYKIALLNSSFTSGRILLRADADLPTMHPLDYPLDEVLVANLLGRGRGVELHGCGVIDRDGRGHLFVGQSGAGKTTTGKVWLRESGIDIVSDDRVIVRDVDGVLRMFGTPWHGEAELSSASIAPLVGVYILRQAPLTELEALAPATASAMLFGCTFPPFYDPAALAFTIEFLADICARVPVRLLRFTPDESVVAAVRRNG